MLRKLLLAFGALATLASATASAQMVIPAHIDLHRGYIVVINDISPKRNHRGIIEPWSPAAALVKSCWSGIACQETRAPFGGRGYINQECCVAAGTKYQLTLTAGELYKSVYVLPRLCNVRGIPFGYAVVEFTGPYTWLDNGIAGEISVRVLDAPCPVDP